MKKYRVLGVALLTVVLTLPLVSCTVSEDDESGSVVRIVSVDPVETALTPDLIQDVCNVDESSGDITYEAGLSNQYVTVTLKNDSTPNTATGSQTNSYVTLTDYKVTFTGLNMSVSLPAISVGGQSVGLESGGSGTMQVLVLDFATMEYITDHYRTVGHSDTLTLRADITIWGEDAFNTRVEAKGSFTMVVANYDRCSS